MEWIENQPVFFGTEDECSDDEIQAQLVDNTDVSQVQFNCEPCPSSPQLIDNYEFTSGVGWSLSAGWSIADYQLCHSGLTTASASNDYIFTDGAYYQVNFTVDSISVGASYDVYIGLTLMGSITSTGDWSFYGYCVESLGTTQLSIVPTVEDSTICISEFTAYEILTNAIVAIYNEAGVYQTQINATDNPDRFVFVKNTVTVTIDWADLGVSNGCYYLCFLDPCVNTNGQNYPADISTFTNVSNWVYEGDVTWPGSSIAFDTEIINEGFFFTQQNVFNSFTTTYCITVSATITLGSIGVYFGANLIQTISATGSYTITGTCAGSFNLTFQNTAEATGSITALSACAVSTDDYECDLTSNTFKIGDYSNDCTLIINACNNEDGLGFVFEGSDFSPRVRLEAKLRQAKYLNERTIYEDSVGKKSGVYFSGRKAKNLCIDLQPEYIHDFLRLSLGFDNFYINTEAYFVEDDEYNVEYPEENDSTGKVKILVSKKVQNLKNINQTDDENVCTLPPNYLLRADSLTDYVTLSDGGLIVISG